MNVERWMARRFAHVDETPEVIEIVHGEFIQRVPPYLRTFTIFRSRRDMCALLTLRRGPTRWHLAGVKVRRLSWGPPRASASQDVPGTPRLMTLAQARLHTSHHVACRPSAWWLALGIGIALMTFGLFRGWLP